MPFCVNLKSFSLKLRGKQRREEKTKYRAIFFAGIVVTFFPLENE